MIDFLTLSFENPDIWFWVILSVLPIHCYTKQVKERMTTRDDEKINNLEILPGDHHQAQADGVQDPVQQVELYIHQVSLLPWHPRSLAQSYYLSVLTLAKLEDHDVADRDEDGAAEEGDTVEEPEGVVDREEPHRAGVKPGPQTREIILGIIEHLTFLTAGFSSEI